MLLCNSLKCRPIFNILIITSSIVFFFKLNDISNITVENNADFSKRFHRNILAAAEFSHGAGGKPCGFMQIWFTHFFVNKEFPQLFITCFHHLKPHLWKITTITFYIIAYEGLFHKIIRRFSVKLRILFDNFPLFPLPPSKNGAKHRYLTVYNKDYNRITHPRLGPSFVWYAV